MIQVLCDACRRKLAPPEVTEAAKAANEAQQPEAFCSACLPRAKAYWQDKTKLVNEATAEMWRRIERHRNVFFATKPIALVEKAAK